MKLQQNNLMVVVTTACGIVLKEGEIKLLVSGDDGKYFMIRVFKKAMVFKTQRVLIIA